MGYNYSVRKFERDDLLSIHTVSSILRRWNRHSEVHTDTELTSTKTTQEKLLKWNSGENRITTKANVSCLIWNAKYTVTDKH